MIRVTVPAVPRAAREVRYLLRAEHGDLACLDDVEMVASELVNNAVLYGLPPVRVLIEPNGALVRIEVADRRPDMGAPAADSRGLTIVESVAQRWGIRYEVPTKVVWAEVGCAQGGQVGER
jgi:anti-sigma regulatory factor (Ser/Thr protein kinase)